MSSEYKSIPTPTQLPDQWDSIHMHHIDSVCMDENSSHQVFKKLIKRFL